MIWFAVLVLGTWRSNGRFLKLALKPLLENRMELYKPEHPLILLGRFWHPLKSAETSWNVHETPWNGSWYSLVQHWNNIGTPSNLPEFLWNPMKYSETTIKPLWIAHETPWSASESIWTLLEHPWDSRKLSRTPMKFQRPWNSLELERLCNLLKIPGTLLQYPGIPLKCFKDSLKPPETPLKPHYLLKPPQSHETLMKPP